MSEWERMCRERARELARKGGLTAWQIAERAGVDEHLANKYIRQARERRGRC